MTWTDAKNERRCDLIDKEIDAELTADETAELAGLQAEMQQYRQKVAPLPIEQIREYAG